MYQDEINRAVACFPDKWWAAEEWRNELTEYWRIYGEDSSCRTDLEDCCNYLSEDEVSVLEEIRSHLDLTEDESREAAKKKSRMREFEKRAEKDNFLKACIFGLVYGISVEEWIEKKRWTLSAQIDDLSAEQVYEDSKELDNLFSDIDWIADGLADHAYDCSDTIDRAEELCEDFVKLPQEQQIRFAVKMLAAEAAKRRPLREEQLEKVATKLKKKSEQMETMMEKNEDITSEADILPY